MASARNYRTTYRRRRSTKKAPRSRGSGFARVKKRSSGRSYRARRRVTVPTTRKRILNITTKKKRDSMMPWSVLDGADAAAPAFMTADKGYQLIWCPTARDKSTQSGQVDMDAKADEAARQSTEVFMRGLKETIQCIPNNGKTWQWRRVCFTLKGAAINSSNGLNQPQPFIENTNGYTRALINYNSTQVGADMLDMVFRGTQNVDWSNVMTASTDQRRVTIKYDRVRILGSGNAEGRVHQYSLWHPMNKTLVYDDDEAGGQTSLDYFSVSSKAGMGDYYVMDIFQCPNGTGSDNLTFSPEATLYWHER
ncbi:capsid protein [Tortoise genomovirus 13]|uniref:Capsid protein n=1 Tax=Tortoise genomovirus 13 TaxID=2582874 RepID=A0A4P8WAI1_9VIRU|nr:capsid protein [Tortoise genomovirus 13]QCS37571.1 capsid protein [Tortoise genomovirus 13]